MIAENTAYSSTSVSRLFSFVLIYTAADAPTQNCFSWSRSALVSVPIVLKLHGQMGEASNDEARPKLGWPVRAQIRSAFKQNAKERN